MAPKTKVSKNKSLEWTPKAQVAFEEIKTTLTQALVIALPCFDKVFEIECDAFVGIGDVLSQEGRALVFFSDNLYYSRIRYYTYDKEFCAIVHYLEH